MFLRGMTLATDSFLGDPLGIPMISNSSRVTRAVPDIFIGSWTPWNKTMPGTQRRKHGNQSHDQRPDSTHA